MTGQTFDRFQNFRVRCASLLVGFKFSDQDIEAAVVAVKALDLAPTDPRVIAMLKLHYMGRLMRQGRK